MFNTTLLRLSFFTIFSFGFPLKISCSVQLLLPTYFLYQCYAIVIKKKKQSHFKPQLEKFMLQNNNFYFFIDYGESTSLSYILPKGHDIII